MNCNQTKTKYLVQTSFFLSSSLIMWLIRIFDFHCRWRSKWRWCRWGDCFFSFVFSVQLLSQFRKKSLHPVFSFILVKKKSSLCSLALQFFTSFNRTVTCGWFLTLYTLFLFVCCFFFLFFHFLHCCEFQMYDFCFVRILKN